MTNTALSITQQSFNQCTQEMYPDITLH